MAAHGRGVPAVPPRAVGVPSPFSSLAMADQPAPERWASRIRVATLGGVPVKAARGAALDFA